MPRKRRQSPYNHCELRNGASEGSCRTNGDFENFPLTVVHTVG